MSAALTTCTRREVATLVRRILSVSLGDGLQAWHAVTQWFKPRSVVETNCVDGEAHIAKAHQERE